MNRYLTYNELSFLGHRMMETQKHETLSSSL